MIPADTHRRLRGLKSLVGNTPVLAVEFLFRGEKRVLHAKAENLNMTGSIKDRMALHIVQMAYERGTIEPGHAFLPRQFSNTDNVEAHEMTTGPEIWWQMQFHGRTP